MSDDNRESCTKCGELWARIDNLIQERNTYMAAAEEWRACYEVSQMTLAQLREDMVRETK